MDWFLPRFRDSFDTYFFDFSKVPIFVNCAGERLVWGIMT